MLVAGATPAMAAAPTILDPANGATNQFFGNAVAISGNTAVVGAPSSLVGGNSAQGAVFVYVLADGAWTLQQELVSGDGAAHDAFGMSVAIDGDTLVVGAEQHAVGGNANQGAAYVFTRTGSIWTQQAELTASDGVANEFFAGGTPNAVAISGGTIAVSAPAKTSTRGEAYVFTGSGATWTQVAALPAPSGYFSFGIAVGVSGSTLAVSSAVLTPGSTGAALIYDLSGGTPVLESTVHGDVAGSNFGFRLALSGSVLAVGAPGEIIAGSRQGAVFVFTGAGPTWTQEAKLTAPDGAASDGFGDSVSIGAGQILVGSPHHQVGSNAEQGVAYLFANNASTWVQQAEVTGPDGTGGDQFGTVAINGAGQAVIGAQFKAVGDNLQQGEAYILDLSPTVWAGTPQNPASLPSGGVLSVTGSIDPGAQQFYAFDWPGGTFDSTATISGATAPASFTFALKPFRGGAALVSTSMSDPNFSGHLIADLPAGTYEVGIVSGSTSDPPFTITFATPVAGGPVAIPTLGETAIAILSAMLAGLGLFLVRGRPRSARATGSPAR